MDKERVLTIWIIYDHPLDYPNDYVVRGWDITNQGDNMPQDKVTRHETLEEARASLPPGLYRTDPFTEDDPAILEVWI
mgnify:CR=1 FL=1